MLPDLVLQQRLLHPLQQLVDGVDVGMDGLKPLDLGPDGGRVGQVLLVVHHCSSRLGRRTKTPELFRWSGQVLAVKKRMMKEGESCDLQEGKKLREASNHAFLLRLRMNSPHQLDATYRQVHN